MKKIIPLLFCLFIVSCASVPKFQIENFKPGFQWEQTIINLGDRFLYIDDSAGHHYTFEFEADKVSPLNGHQMFAMDNTHVQVNSIPFTIGDYSVKGSKEAEDYALFKHIRWERDYQEKSYKHKLNEDVIDYESQKGKLFKIWWLQVPEDHRDEFRNEEKGPDEEIVVTSHMLFMEYIIHGKFVGSLGFAVYEHENLNDKIEELKKIADTFKFYGFPIDIERTVNRLVNKSYVFEDAKNKFSLELPEPLKLTQPIYGDNVQIFSLPEKENIINCIGFSWYYDNEFETLEEFVAEIKNRLSSEMENPTIINSTADEKRIYYTKSEGYFNCQVAMLKYNNMYFLFEYIATETTYDFNLARFNELIDNLK